MRIRSFTLATVLAVFLSTSVFAETQFDLLASQIFTPEIQKSLPRSPAGKAGFAVFFSVSDGDSRAIVRHGTGHTLNAAWNKATEQIQSAMNEKNLTGKWIKVDIVSESKKISFDDFSREIREAGVCLYRRGVSFDAHFTNAFIEEELNGTAAYIGTKSGGLNSLSALKDYFAAMKITMSIS